MSVNQQLLDNIAIVLLHPKYPENIGSAVRAAWNMGITRMIVVADEYPEHARMAKLATHNAAHLLDRMEFHENLADALAPFSLVIGTTARKGRQRISARPPRKIIQELLPLLPENQVAFLFGPEDSGLSNEALDYCQQASAIPTADFSSLNLAQAVAIHCYEIYHGVVHEQKPPIPAPKIASSHELENMYQQVAATLTRIDFLHEKSHTYYMRNIRQFLGKIQMNSRETTIVRRICQQFVTHGSNPGGINDDEDGN
ncbi:MAG: TrmH family RNA methyltransferase [Thermodesulfobacteriota bacterium]